MAKKQHKPEADADPVTKRLDALLRLFIETNKAKGRENFTEATAARLLKSAGLTPKEIARILGKSRLTDLSKYFYSKGKGLG